ncbi:PAS domain S-box-containing protein [Pseudomonas sp. NFACC02]|uniref:PAS domain-containing hybrid sensor histidine kinase/response regulator n=1 Tax=Pseudomonas sp. NFACC02 TaxID=1566250 RepID=UPI0008BE15B5|nr:PAS domain S-box protein [Pseudomonas sp. NFACC02]SEQ16153.1 PAS domain S-box-containing protein [Pseudomonas sp. NFACC02]
MRLIKSFREAAVCVAVIVAIGITVTVMIYQVVRKSTEYELNTAVDKATQNARGYVLKRMADYQYGLRGVRGAVAVAATESDGFDHALFVRYLQGEGADSEFDGARGFGFIRRVPESELQAFLSSVQKEADAAVTLQQFEPRAGERYIIQYIEPAPQNNSGLGLDIGSEPNRRMAAERAMRSGEPQLTAPITLRLSGVQPSPSMLLLMPVYRSVPSPTTVPDRERLLLGWSFTGLIVTETLRDMELPRDVCLHISDITDGDQAPAFFSKGHDCDASNVMMSRDEDKLVYGRLWRFHFGVGPGFAKSLHLVSPTLVLGIGSLFTLILAASGVTLLISSIRRSRLLREQSRLAAIVESSTDGIISKTLEGVITSWNGGAQTIFGYRAEEAIGRRLEDLVVPRDRIGEERDILQRIAKGIPILSFDTVRHRKDGSFVDVSVNISPLIDARGEVVGASKTVRDISMQKQAEARILELNAGLEDQIAERTAQLRNTNLMLSSVLRSATEVAIIATDCDGLIKIFNAGAERMLGYSEQELVGRATPHVFHLAQELAQRSASLRNETGLDTETFEPLVSQCRTDGSSTREWTFVRKDGSQFPVTLMATEIRDELGELTGFLGIAVDITRREAVQKELTAARDQLLMAAEVAQLGIWSWTIEADDLQWNDRMFDFYFQPLELRESGLHFAHWLERIHPDDRARIENRLRDISAGERVEDQTFRVVSPQGQIRVIQSGAHLERDSAGKPMRVTGINLDITAQCELQARLLEAKERADAASDAKSTFLANMSHEIRTPLNAVLGMLQLLTHAGLDSRQAGYVINARTAASSLLSLLNDILDYSKIEANKLHLDIHPFDLDQLLRDLAVILVGNQSRSAAEVLFELDPTLPVHLMGDSLRLQQVLINLAGNALKFTPQGQVVVRFIRLSSGDRVGIRVEVEDSGIGIQREHLAHIFEGFSQAQASTTRRYGGTGLGLAICKRLVAMMGGELRIRSEVGKGSCFWFDIELEQDAAFEHSNLKKNGKAGLRLLVVDDNDVARQILSKMVNGMGWEVDTADSAAAAFQRIRDQAATRPYDVILMDWDMPVMNGLTAARQLAQATDVSPTPAVVMITAYSHDMLHRLAPNERPFRAMLSKPLTPAQLAEAVHTAMTVDASASESIEPFASGKFALSGLRLLVIEDNALNRLVAQELLEQEGATVDLAEGGLSGIARLNQCENAFDAVLMDIQMPDIDGYEATRRIRNDVRFRDLPIIAMTANASDEDRKATLAAGMDAHLAKPIDLPHVVATLQRCVQWANDPLPALCTQGGGDVEPFESILARLGGNHALLGTLSRQFCTEISALIASLQQTVATDDHSGAKRVLHTIKGNAGNLGARGLSTLAGKLERELQRMTGSPLSRLLTTERLAELERVATGNVEQLLAMVGSDAGISEQNCLTYPAFREHLEAIAPLLESHNLRGVTMIEALADYHLPCSPHTWERLNQRLRTLDFEGASSLLQALLRAGEDTR